MKRSEWIQSLPEHERVFRITQGCDRCGMYELTENGYHCRDEKTETACRKDFEKWLNEEMDF